MTLGDDEQSEESSDAEVTKGDADDTKNTVAHDTQMRYSPSLFPDSTQVCVETDVNRPKEKGQPGQPSKQLLKRLVKLQNRSSRALCRKPSRLRAQWCQTPWRSIQEWRGACHSGVLE